VRNLIGRIVESKDLWPGPFDRVPLPLTDQTVWNGRGFVRCQLTFNAKFIDAILSMRIVVVLQNLNLRSRMGYGVTVKSTRDVVLDIAKTRETSDEEHCCNVNVHVQ